MSSTGVGRIRHRRRPGGAFTLIELLVVISIIALLIAILLPALAMSRGTARTLLCLTNMRGFGQAVYSYAQENKGFIPRDYDPGAHLANPPHVLLPEVLCSYLGGPDLAAVPALAQSTSGSRDQQLATVFKDLKFLKCPSFPAVSQAPFTAVNPLTGKSVTVAEQTYQYVTNAFTFPGSGGAPNLTDSSGSIRIDQVPLPSRLYYFTEANQNRLIDNFTFHDLWQEDHLWWQNGNARMIGGNDKRHASSFNGIFFDNHGKTMPFRFLDAKPHLYYFTPP